MTVATLALGSNLGERAANLDRAQAALAALPASPIAASTRHETPALLPPGAPADWDIPFLNAVVQVETDLAPAALLAAVKRIEHDLGRRPGPRWSPRLIDIDILAVGTAVHRGDGLEIPHPELANRLFVLRPWAEIDPGWTHPHTGLTVARMLADLESEPK